MDNVTKAKIELEISQIDKALNTASPLIKLCKSQEPDYVGAIAMAQILHSFYNGIECIITIIMKDLCVKLPNDHSWHKTLLEMAFGQNRKELKIFRDDLSVDLKDYLAFRHFVRHSYFFQFKWSEMKPKVEKLEDTWVMVKSDIELFINKSGENK